MFSWTLHMDATNALGLDRVMQHYTMVKRNIPDLNLDGKVDATDATTLANNMGTSTTNTGMATDAQFDAFYMNGNWEKGDHDGNGFINQSDADWLAGRYTASASPCPTGWRTLARSKTSPARPASTAAGKVVAIARTPCSKPAITRRMARII